MIRAIDSLFWVGAVVGVAGLMEGYGLPCPRFVGKVMGTLISYKNEDFSLPLYRILESSFLFLFVCQAIVAVGLRTLSPFARFGGVGVAVLGLFDSGFMGFHLMGYQLFGAPQSTACCCMVLWLLLSSKGKFIFSKEYRNVIRQTPHIKSKYSLLIWGAVLTNIGVSTLLTFLPAILYLLHHFFLAN